MKYFLLVLLAAISFTAQSAEIPIRRNFVTTNTFMNAPSDGWIAIWNNTAKQWSNSVNTASSTNLPAYLQTATLTNLSGTGLTSGATNASAYIGSSSGLGTNITIRGLTNASGGFSNSAKAYFGDNIWMAGNLSNRTARPYIFLDGSIDSGIVIDNPTTRIFIDTTGGFGGLVTTNGSGNQMMIWDGVSYSFMASPTGSVTYGHADFSSNIVGRGGVTLPSLTASRPLILNAFGDVTNSAAVSDVELEYLDGVTSAIQGQLGSKQAGTFLLTNFSAMGITNIVSANANTVITTNAGVLTLTTAGTGSPGGNSADVQFNQSGSFAGTNTFTYDRTNNILTAGSFYGSGTGTPILKLQTMMAADNALALSVRTNFTQLSTNFLEFTSPSAGQAMVLHSASAGQLVWTNATAAAGGGSTTNVPPVVLAINDGTGTTNVIIDMWVLAQMSTNSVQITLTANAGIVVTNVVAGKELVIDVIQDSTGNRTIAASSVGGAPLRFGTDITGFGLSTNGTYKDHIKLRGVGTNAHVVGMIRGYAP